MVRYTSARGDRVVRICLPTLMKFYILISILLISLSSNAQGTCANNAGYSKLITYTPSSHQQLIDSGYCTSIGPTKSFTMCYMIVPDLNNGCDSVTVNSGWSASGCLMYSFSNETFYSYPSCISLGTGFTLGSITSDTIVWCFTGRLVVDRTVMQMASTAYVHIIMSTVQR